MLLPIYQVDAFADHLFAGNPAAVCPIDAWLSDETMQAIARENNLSETAFFAPEGEQFRIRWFTPTSEVKLCGHATLASAFVYFTHMAPHADRLVLQSLSGPLAVTRQGDLLTLDFPAVSVAPVEAPHDAESTLGAPIVEAHAADDWLFLVASADAVRSLKPDMRELRGWDKRGVIVTAKGEDCDFVSRFFVPKLGVDEDPVTGSAHTKLAPYWGHRLGKTKLLARQLSSRGGTLHCEVVGDRVKIGGRAVPYLIGTITV